MTNKGDAFFAPACGRQGFAECGFGGKIALAKINVRKNRPFGYAQDGFCGCKALKRNQ